MQMRVPQDERSYGGDRGLQNQLPNPEPNTNPNPTGDRENGRIDANEKVEEKKVVERVVKETVVEIENQETESYCELCERKIQKCHKNRHIR